MRPCSGLCGVSKDWRPLRGLEVDLGRLWVVFSGEIDGKMLGRRCRERPGDLGLHFVISKLSRVFSPKFRGCTVLHLNIITLSQQKNRGHLKLSPVIVRANDPTTKVGE